jgi:hypothetical protein
VKTSLTHEMADFWLVVSLGNAGCVLPVNMLMPGRFGYEAPPGSPPVVLVNGDLVRDVYVTYNIDEVKRGRWLD